MAVSAAIPTWVSDDDRIESLIVLFAIEKSDALSPATVIDAVSGLSSESLSQTKALVERLGSPVGARWVVEHRLTTEQLKTVQQKDGSSPEAVLQRFVLLEYADSAQRKIAHALLNKDAGVEHAVSNVVFGHEDAFGSRPNDTYVVSGPGASPQGYQWSLEKIRNMSPYANPAQPAGRDLADGFAYIGIVDSGIDTGVLTGGLSPEFADSFRAHFSQSFYTGTCTSPNLTDVDELGLSTPVACRNGYLGHGTHVAGVIAAKANNSYGVAGVCASCSLIIARAYQANTSSAAALLNGFLHSIIRGAQVINRSGAPFYIEATYGQAGLQTCANLVAANIADAWCNALAIAESRSVVVVAASGNDGDPTKTGFPAREPNSASVAATSSDDTLWGGSNLLKVNFVAPGNQIVSTFYKGGTWNAALGCADSGDGVANNGFDQCTGTSMATPHVTGVMGVVRSVDPLRTAYDARGLVWSTARILTFAPPLPQRYMPDQYAATNAAMAVNGSVTPMFAMVNRVGSTDWNRFFTIVPQMAAASIVGTMLPTSVSPLSDVQYIPDPNAPTVSTYSSFPGVASSAPRAYFKVWTRPVIYGVTMLPLYRLSKLQNKGDGTDACGYAPPVPAKPYKVIHVYSTNSSEKASLMANASGACYNFDGIEGYVAPYDTGGLQPLYRAVSLTANAWILVPGIYLGIANGLGFTTAQSVIGWVIPN
jgi:serine protease